VDGPTDGRPRTLFFGSGAFAVPVLDALARTSAVDLVGVVTAPPRPAGRDQSLRLTPVGEAAVTLELPSLSPARLREDAALAALADLRPGLIVLADYGRLVPRSVLDLPAHGALNLHPSLLPRHRGASPIPAAILEGDAETGVTLMLMDEGLDTGPIVASRRLPLQGDEVAPELEERLAAIAADLLVETLTDHLAGRITPTAQPLAGATLTRPLRRGDGRLDAERPASTLERQVRAFQPWPGSFLEDGDARLVVWRSSVTDPSDPLATRGALVPDGDALALVTADGWLRLDEVQPAGRARMSGAAYRRGRR
jgi:methionyl-tRNA formyltransferase